MLMENKLVFSSDSIGAWIGSCLGEGKWLRPASGAAAPRELLPARKGLTEIGISQNSLSTVEHGEVEIGARSFSASVGNSGRVLQFLDRR